MGAIMTMCIPSSVSSFDIERIILAHVSGYTALDSCEGVWIDGNGKRYDEAVCQYLISAPHTGILDQLRRSILAYLDENTEERALFAPIHTTGRAVFYTQSELKANEQRKLERFAAVINSRKEGVS